ncbi:hypothetical protein [Vibrio anguillarum]|uniref:hypothetical protein n=1 Tax=Vibrio anguillarum TaxID=55601 RepID=UPI002FE47F57
MNNLDVFNVAVLEILYRCVDSVPVKVLIKPRTVALDVSNYFDVPDRENEYSPEMMRIEKITINTILWLKEEGFINTVGECLDGSVHATLSMKGLNAINRVPDSLNDTKSFKQLIYEAVPAQSLSGVCSLVSELFQNAS